MNKYKCHIKVTIVKEKIMTFVGPDTDDAFDDAFDAAKEMAEEMKSSDLFPKEVVTSIHLTDED